MDRLKLKNQAKESLKGHYLEFYKMVLIFCLVTFALLFAGGLLDVALKTNFTVIEEGVPTTVGLFSSILDVAATALFSFGLVSFILKISRNEEVTYKELFSKTNLWFSFIAISFFVTLFCFLWSLLLIIPGIIAAFAYKMVYYVKLDNPEMGALEVLKKSKEIMNGHKWEFFVLELSFFGWIVLGVCTLGILYLWLVPYMAVTECNFYNKIKTNK